MENTKQKYGLWTGIAMVIGIVIGSGVFLKAGGVLSLSGGDLKISILAWFVGGIIMVASGFCFAVFASRVTKYNGVVDYVEEATNKKIGYGLAWMITTFYYPIIASIVSLFAGSYFFKLFGIEVGLASYQNMIFATIVLVLFSLISYFAPLLSSKLQISSTVIKLLPIAIIAITGLFASLIVGGDYGIFNALSNNAEGYSVNFGEAVKKTAFAYEGWVCATSINAELKDSKKNLPRALTIGTIAILVFYIIYYVSLSAFLGNSQTIIQDANAPIAVFEKIMGKIGGIVFTIFIMISCLGTVNGLSMSCTRGMYTMSCRGLGIMPEKFSIVKENRSVSFLSCLYGLGCMLLMLVVWFLAINSIGPFKYLGTMDEIICAIVYAIYITMYIYIMKNFKECNIFQRYIMPILAIIGSAFFVFCGTGLYQLIVDHKTDSLISFGVFMVLFVILMAPSIFFYRETKESK